MAAVLAALCAALLTAGCVQKPAAAQETPSAADTAPVGLMTVSTRYGDLHFSDRWGESLRIEQSSSDSTEIAVFTAVIDGQTYPMFRVEIVDSAGDPDAVGTLTDRQGVRRDVFVSMTPLADGEYPDRLYAMREGVNDLIDELK